MTAEAEGRDAAEGFRRDHRLGVQPLGDLVTVVEQAAGIDVAVVDVEPDEHGMTMRDPARGAVFVAVARTPHPMRQRSTLAHELGHVLFGDWVGAGQQDWADRTGGEVRANAFARHLLVPAGGLREFLGDRPAAEQSTLSAVVQRFLVSPAIAAIALHDARYVDEAVKNEWMGLTTPVLAARFGWSDQYRALQEQSNRTRAPQRLLARAVQGYLSNVVSVQALANLRGIDPEKVEAELNEAGLVPGQAPIAWAGSADLPQVDVDLSELDDENAEEPPG